MVGRHAVRNRKGEAPFQQQTWSRESKLAVGWDLQLSKPVTLLTRWDFLNLPRPCHHLGAECSNVWLQGWHSHSNYHTLEDWEGRDGKMPSGREKGGKKTGRDAEIVPPLAWPVFGPWYSGSNGGRANCIAGKCAQCWCLVLNSFLLELSLRCLEFVLIVLKFHWPMARNVTIILSEECYWIILTFGWIFVT